MFLNYVTLSMLKISMISTDGIFVQLYLRFCDSFFRYNKTGMEDLVRKKFKMTQS